MSYLVLALKWRPQRFADVAGQGPVSRTLSNALKTGRAAQAYLFTGPRGVGKTSMARILAKALNCVQAPTEEPCNECPACREITAGHAMDVFEIDGASNRGIGDIRELREAVLYAPATLARKVYIIDEVHMLTQDAFNALLKTLEEPPRHVVFILATTEPLKVPQTILSRCQRFDFARLGVKDATARLRYICEQEKIETEEDALVLIARRGEGSMRDALTLLDQVVATGLRPLTVSGVREALGLPSREVFFEWTEAIAGRNAPAALLSLARAVEGGANLQELVEEFLSHLRNLLLVATDPSLSDLLETTEEEAASYLRQAREMSAPDLLRYCRLCLDTAGQMRRSAFPRTHLEVVLAEMCSLPTALDLKRFIEVARGRAGDEPEAGRSAGRPGIASAPAGIPSPRGARGAASQRPGLFGGAGGASVAGVGGAVSDGARDVGAADPGAEQPIRLTSMDALLREREGAPTGAAARSGSGAWQDLLAEVAARKPALATCLADSWVSGEEENCLCVRIPGLSSFQQEQIERKQNRQFLLELIEKNFGRPLGLRCSEAPEGGAGGPAEPAIADAAGTRSAGPAGGARRVGEKPPSSSSEGIQRIADLFDGDVIGPA